MRFKLTTIYIYIGGWIIKGKCETVSVFINDLKRHFYWNSNEIKLGSCTYFFCYLFPTNTVLHYFKFDTELNTEVPPPITPFRRKQMSNNQQFTTATPP